LARKRSLAEETGRAPRAARTAKTTRIQRENAERIIEAALDVFAREGFRGATIDQIAEAAEMSKPNLLYYFPGKEEVYRALLDRLLQTWLDPLREMDAGGEPEREIRDYIRRKLEMARDYPRESRLFAGEIMRGAPLLDEVLKGPLKALVDEKAAVIAGWIDEGRLAPHDPRHLIFAIWATTQHYADFDAQVRAVLGSDAEGRFHDAARFLETLFLKGLRPRA
jgi:TetR/AcrR family transcriptional regulator